MRPDETDAGLAASARLLPPVTSRPGGLADASPAGEETIAPPSVWQPPESMPAAPSPAMPIEPEAVDVEAVAAPEPVVAEAASTAQPMADLYDDEPWALAAVTETEQPAEPDEWSPEPAVVDGALEELTIEPPFAGDTSAVDAVLESIDEVPMAEEALFPLDAFIMPEAPLEDMPTEPQPTEAETTSAAAQESQAETLADRLEQISRQLRAGDADAAISRLAAGDKLDALLAGLLAGFLAGSRD